jgi:hypothetical protein
MPVIGGQSDLLIYALCEVWKQSCEFGEMIFSLPRDFHDILRCCKIKTVRITYLRCDSWLLCKQTYHLLEHLPN